MQTDLFDHAVKGIAEEYAALGHQLGWRFLGVSSKTLDPTTEIALITANPGGDIIPEDHPSASCEDGSAYLVEKWGTSPAGGHRLQRQVQALFNAIAVTTGLGESAGAELLTRSLIGYFIPFRSPRLDQLHKPRESTAFATRLWTGLFQVLSPRLIVTIDPTTHRQVKAILRANGGASLVSSANLRTEWGQTTASVAEYRNASYKTMLLRLPHLSSYQLFARAECRQPLQSILDQACKYLG